MLGKDYDNTENLAIFIAVLCFLNVMQIFSTLGGLLLEFSFIWNSFQVPLYVLQVSTWFANARRRLKKENKVTWSPRACKTSDERGCDEDSSEAEKPLRNSTHLHGKKIQSQFLIFWMQLAISLPVA